MSDPTDHPAPVIDLAAIQAAQRDLAGRIRLTPVFALDHPELHARLAPETRVVAKLELLQQTGSFKARGALLNLRALSAAQRARGVTCVSAGNHAIATAFAAAQHGVSAKLVMPQSASAVRVARCRQYGAEVVLADDVHAAFAIAERLRDAEGRAFIHPFEGYHTALGTATCGAEFAEQAGDLDALIVPVGGGGLAAGMSRAFKLLQPRCRVIGVEPVGADSMHRSLRAGTPQQLDKVATIADSLGAPLAMPYSFGLCRDHLDDSLLIEDALMIEAMRVLFDCAKLAVEPAGAASLAALLGPLRESLAGQRVGVIVCGSNIDTALFCRLLHTDRAS